MDHHVLTPLPGGQRLPLMTARLPDPAQVADAVARFLALREFRWRLYACLTARADALFELTDAILCADHAVTSLVQLSLVPQFTRGHGALYDALAAGRIDEEALAALLRQMLPPLVDGDQGRAWISEHDKIGYGLLEAALARVPAEQAARVRDACARWSRLRFAVDATPCPRPDAGCSPERGHVHHDACRCDSTRKTVPGREYQFVAAPGHLRAAWSALIDVGRTTAAARTRQTIGQVTSVLRRLATAGNSGRAAPLFVFDAGYSAAALTAGPAGYPVHLLVRLAAGQVFFYDAARWPGKNGRPGTHGIAVRCRKAGDAGQSSPGPDESLVLPGTPACGTVRAGAWRGVHPQIHGDRGWFADWDGDLPVLRGTLLRVTVGHLPDGRVPPKAMWLWHAGPAPLSCDDRPRRPQARRPPPPPAGRPRHGSVRCRRGSESEHAGDDRGWQPVVRQPARRAVLVHSRAGDETAPGSARRGERARAQRQQRQSRSVSTRCRAHALGKLARRRASPRRMEAPECQTWKLAAADLVTRPSAARSFRAAPFLIMACSRRHRRSASAPSRLSGAWMTANR